jgi:ribosomal-protein-alanine N-acetyltransferase
MSGDVQLREYRNDDLEAIFRLDQVCFAEPFRFSKRAMRQFAEARNALTIVAATEDERIAGFAIAHVERSSDQRAAYVVTLDVSPQDRRRGLARELVATLERQAQTAGCAEMVLHVWVENAGAISFYERLGYLRAQRARGFYGPQRDAWVYGKALRS